MFTSTDLKKIITEARPIVERQLDDALLIAGFRTKVTDDGGDWGQVKALLKAMIQDERDEAGGNKRVTALLDKADHATAYADMLGLMNEKNSFEEFRSEPGTFLTHSDGLAGPANAADERTANTKPAPISQPAHPAAGSSGETPEQTGAVARALDAAPVIPFTAADNARKLRPFCLHTDDLTKCAGVGKKHCFACQKAHADDVGEAA